ncbi:MAG: hypothetical protein U5K56_19425 [Halioglobus sp.]|nr:hypothetical protein [Halioglobus sp.]
MDEKTLKALVDAGAVKRVNIIGNGTGLSRGGYDFHRHHFSAMTLKGTPKTWRSLDAAAKWVRGLGMGNAYIDLARWEPGGRQV